DLNVVSFAFHVENASDALVSEERDLADRQVLRLARLRVDGPQQAFRTDGPNGVRASFDDHDVVLIGDAGIRTWRAAVQDLRLRQLALLQNARCLDVDGPWSCRSFC